MGATGQTTTYGYANYDNFKTVTDPLLRLTTHYNDKFGRVTSTADPANGTTTFTYDAKDRLASVKDPRNLTTTYTYDGLGNLTRQVSPDTGTTNFTFDAAGNVTSQTDARSVVTTYTHDSLNRVLAATVADGTVTYEYDNTATGGPYALGRLTKVTDPSGSTTWTYDALGRVTGKTQIVTASPANKVFTVGYSHAQGRQSGMTYPSGRVVTYGFDAAGQVNAIAIDGVALLSAGEYFPFGGPRRWLWGNGEAWERTFDLDGRVKSATLGPSTATYAALEQGFAYDALDRLTSASVAAGQVLGYGYDANGNRTSTTVNGGPATTYTYPGTSHRLSALTGANPRSFTYDAAGNLTASAGTTYAYDGRGRMKQAGSTTYLVNGLGQRVRKTAGSEYFFAYDEAGRLLGEYDLNGAPIQETVWLGDLPVATIRPMVPAGHEIFYVWADNLGSPRAVSDVANQLRWTWEPNDPFGRSMPNENPAGQGAFEYNLRFPGQYFDAETGTHYNYFRDYDPAIGRYVQSDPIGLRAGANTYGYVGGNPLASIDPEGLQAVVCIPPVCFPVPMPPPPVPNGSGSGGADGAGGGSNVIPFPGRGSKGEPQSCEPDDDCAKEQRRLEANKTRIRFYLKIGRFGASAYRGGAMQLNEQISQHNALCPRNRVEKLDERPPIDPVK